jgi:hypothetical protein
MKSVFDCLSSVGSGNILKNGLKVGQKGYSMLYLWKNSKAFIELLGCLSAQSEA